MVAALACVALGVTFLGGVARAAGSYPLDPDQAAKASTDVNISLRTLSDGTYSLLVQNQSGIGYIDSFAWVPGPGWKVTAIIGTKDGKCTLADGGIACVGKIDPPEKCTCQPGGRMTITLKMHGPSDPRSPAGSGRTIIGTAGSYFVVKTMTAVGHHIPSALPPPANT